MAKKPTEGIDTTPDPAAKPVPLDLIVECPKCGANDWTVDPLTCKCNACGFDGKATEDPLAPNCEPCNGEGKTWGGDGKARPCEECDGTGEAKTEDPLTQEAIAEIKTVVPVLSKTEARSLLAACDRGSQHCSECPAFGCCDNTAIRAREHGDNLVDTRESEVGVRCVRCGKRVEHARECYAIPHCYECLPAPEPLPVALTPEQARTFLRRAGVSNDRASRATIERKADRVARALEADPAPPRPSVPVAPVATRESFVCPECGPGAKADDEHCCAACGADCAVVAVHEPTESEREQGILKADVSIPVCPLQPRLGANLSTLLPQVDVRAVLDLIIAKTRDGDDPTVHEFLVKLRARLARAEADLCAEKREREITVASIASQDNDPIVRTDDGILSRVIETCNDETVRDGLTRIRKALALTRESRDTWERAARKALAEYPTDPRRTPSNVDPEDDCASQCVEVIAANANAHDWRTAIEWALGVEPDPIEHTPEWAEELVRAVREIGNKAHVENEMRRRVAREVFDPTQPARLVNAEPVTTTDDLRAFAAFDASPTDRAALRKLASTCGATGDEKTKRTLSDMPDHEVRERALRCVHSTGTTSDDIARLVTDHGLTVVSCGSNPDSPGHVVVTVREPDNDPRITEATKALSHVLPATVTLEVVSHPATPYR